MRTGQKGMLCLLAIEVLEMIYSCSTTRKYLNSLGSQVHFSLD
uniref:Uncharacterized protein n=1 Tax=Arundo donax TaxID=35708 RepID=A0A0A9Q6M3_ARUDO